MNSCLIIDSSYTLKAFKKLNNIKAFEERSLGGFFDNVYHVHNFDFLQNAEEIFELPKISKVDDTNYYFPATKGVSRLIPGFLNFFIIQTYLFYKCYKIIRLNKIKLIRVGDPLFLGLFGFMLSKITGSKLVLRLNGNNKDIRQNTNSAIYPSLLRFVKLEIFIEKFLFKRFDGIICPNDNFKEYAVSYGANIEKIVICRYGTLIPDHYFHDYVCRDKNFIDNINLEKEAISILFVGRLEKLKYFPDVLKLFEELMSLGVKFNFIVVGNGPLKDDLKRYEDNIELKFFEFLDQDKLYELYNAVDIFFSPLTGRALCEAALMKCHVIAYDIDWQPEIIINQVTGSLVDVGNLSLAMECIKLADFERTKLKENLQSYARKILNPKTIRLVEIDFFEKIIDL